MAKSLNTVLLIFTLTIGISAMLLLIPYQNLSPVFAKGEFLYPQSLGKVLLFLTILIIVLYFLCPILINIKNKLVMLITLAVVLGFSMFFLFFIITTTWIGFDVKTQCQDAKSEYSKDCVESLINLLRDENKGFRIRNHAIWALGQLGDIRALSVLQSFYTGNIPDREPLNQTISQYELKKAINLTSGGQNITAIFWR